MITHFAGLTLPTVSLANCKQFYHQPLQMPIAEERKTSITFRVTPDCSLTFEERFEPLAPVHFAFEVPPSAFDQVVAFLEIAHIPLLAWPDGRIIDTFETGRNVYFRDCDGNLLEIIMHDYVQEGVIAPFGKLSILYMREIGFPVESVAEHRAWLLELFGSRLAKVYDNFTFAVNGTAHHVVTSVQRRWIPIGMIALPPRMQVTYGVSDSSFLERIASHLSEAEILQQTDRELVFQKDKVTYQLLITNVDPNIPKRLQLPGTEAS
ncbi:glyoxalase/bleomycin resistance/dioxygenase family protein [Paenibacillus oryzisoli]|uniref:VOC family protein n=1 Tax=Paenibacillus oryzisoli TaxID=1850517 RepID=UPI003D265F3D